MERFLKFQDCYIYSMFLNGTPMCPAVNILYEDVLLVVLNIPKLFKRAWNILRIFLTKTKQVTSLLG